MIMAELDPTKGMPLAPLDAARINKADAAEARLRLQVLSARLFFSANAT